MTIGTVLVVIVFALLVVFIFFSHDDRIPRSPKVGPP